jgi:hypothetical protein
MKVPGTSTLLALSAAGILAVGVAGVAFAADGGVPGGDSGETRDHRGPHRHPRGIGLYEIVEASGIDSEVFREGWQNGQSINDTLQANGLDPAAVADEVLADLEAKLDERVANGELDEERAAEILANATERLATFMSTVPDLEGRPRPHIRFAAGKGIVESAAETIGITVRELIGEIIATDGTIASVAEAHGVAVQDVVDNAVAQAIARIDEAVANNRITLEKAEELKDTIVERVERFVNEGPKPRWRHLPGRPFAGDDDAD